MNVRPLLLLLAALITGPLLPTPASAQQPPVSLELQAGLDREGQYRVGHWFPVAAVAVNDGADMRATLAIRFPGDSESSFRYELDLPGGARKRVVVPVVTVNSHGTAIITLESNGQELLRQNVPLDPINSDQLVVGVISSDPALLNSLRAIRSPNGLDVAVVHLDPAALPDSAMLLAGMGALFVHDLATAELAPAQREALAVWTRLGGQLIVGGGSSAERTVPGLAELLPVDVGTLRADVSAAPLASLVDDRQLPVPTPLTALSVALRPDANNLVGDGLIVERAEGAGRVLFTAFDLAALRTWAGEAALWQELLEHTTRVELGQNFRIRNENLMRDALQTDSLRLPSTAVLLLLVALYIVVVGPLNFWLLRRAGRVELAWVTTPLIVVAFLLVAYGASFVLRGTSARITQLTVVQGVSGADRGQATSFLAVFSPQRRSFNVGFPTNSLVTPGSFEDFTFNAAPVTSDEASVELRDLLIDVSSLRTLLVEQPTAVAPVLELSLEQAGGRLNGEVRLVGGPALSDVQIVVGDSGDLIGELSSGESASFSFDTRVSNFPFQFSLQNEGAINRERVISSLFGYDRFASGGPNFQGDQGQGLPDRDGLYLLGWANQTPLQVTLDDAAIDQQGETLYIIRLDNAP